MLGLRFDAADRHIVMVGAGIPEVGGYLSPHPNASHRHEGRVAASAIHCALVVGCDQQCWPVDPDNDRMRSCRASISAPVRVRV